MKVGRGHQKNIDAIRKEYNLIRTKGGAIQGGLKHRAKEGVTDGLVPLKDADGVEYDHVNYYITQKMSCDLWELTVGRSMPESVVKWYALNLIRDISETNSFNYVHRDIKPENILVSEVGSLCISDYGSTAIISKECKEFDYGTVGYQPPEMFMNIFMEKPYDNTKVDIFSLGATLIWMHAGA